MPRITRRRLRARHISIDDLHIPDLLDLACGWTPNQQSSFKSLEEIREFYWQNRDGFSAVDIEGNGGFLNNQPGTRPWVFWLAELPECPRLNMSASDVGPMTSAEIDFETVRTWWGSADGFEPAVLYLIRRELLQPGELSAIAKHPSNDPGNARFFECFEPDDWDLATLRIVLDPNDAKGLFTPDEISRARDCQRLWESRVAELGGTSKRS